MKGRGGRRWLVLAVVLGVVVAGVSGVGRAQERKVVIVSWGGDYQDALREAYWKPFEKKMNVKVVEDTRPLPPRIKAMVETGKVEWDVVDLTDGQYTEIRKIGGVGGLGSPKPDTPSLHLIH